MKVSTGLLPIKAHYFLFNAGAACMIPFLTVLAKDMGLSSTVVGLVYTILPLLGMVVKPTLGALADKFKIQRVLCAAVIVFCCVSLFLIPWIPPLPSKAVGTMACGNGATEIKLASPLVDKCLDGTLEKYTLNSTIKCQLKCAASGLMIIEICNEWGQPQFCSSNKQFGDNAYHSLIQNIHNRSDLLLNHTRTVRGFSASPQTVEFQGVFNAYKHEVIEKSLFFRVESVEFPNRPAVDVHPFCNHSLQMDCDLTNCDDPIIDTLFANPAVPDSEVPHMYQFWLLVLFIIGGWVGQAGGVSLGDSICFELLGDNPSKYGDQRLWGSVGWGLFSVITGAVVDRFSTGASKNYIPAIWIMLVLFVLNVIVVLKMDYQQTKTSPSILHDVGRLLVEARILVFLIWCIFCGIGTALIWNFLLWHLEDLANDYSCDMKAWIKTLEGLVMGIQCFGGELPFFFLSGRILKKLGHVNCMTLVLFALGIRFLLYSILVNPWYCVPIEFMNGITFGLFYATMASYASIVALPGTETTMQGLVGAVFEGVGVSLGSFMGGILFDKIGGGKAFQIFGYGAIIASIVHAMVQYFISRRFSVVHLQERDFKHPRYASPQDAIHMLQDQHNSSLQVVT